MEALTPEKLSEAVRQYNEDPRVMAWRAEQDAKRTAVLEEAAERSMNQQREFNEKVRLYNEAHANQTEKKSPGRAS